MESYHTLLTKLPTTTSVYIYITNYWKRLTPFTRPFYFIFAIYSLAMLSIWRANFSYMDDLKRALEGYAWSHDFNRYSSSWLSYALNANDVLSDISPFSQIIAMVLLSAASIIITHVFCKRKIEYLPLVLSAFIGLIPFMLGCWVFKFDAPGIALSILASVVPFLFFVQPEVKFTKKTLLFGFLSVFCLMIMWTSYQASSGIYLVVVLGWTLNAFLERINVKKIINQVGIFIGIYIASILAYKIFFPDINGAGYRQTELFPLSEIATGIFHNIQSLLTTLRTSLHPEWAYLVMLMAICFMITLVIRGKYGKLGRLANLFAGILFVITSIPLSYGAYLVLQDAPIEGRSLVGVGFILAIMAIITFNNLYGLWRCILVVPSLILLYSFMVFAWAFGNGLADQERYGNFRLEMLLGDLA